MTNLKDFYILAVDDKPENLKSLSALIEDFDYPILCAQSGEEALKYLLTHNIILVLMDVQMPLMDGFETVRLIKANKKTQNIPIIYLTAIDKDIANVLQGYETGAVDYITKPIDPGYLRAKISVFLDLMHKKYLLNEEVKMHQEAKEKLAAFNETLKEKNNEILKHLNFNSITALPNYHSLEKYLYKYAGQTHQALYLLFIDFKNFGEYYTTYGHEKGDAILREISQRIQRIIGQEGYLSHINADEFIIVLENPNRDYIVNIAEYVQRVMNYPYYLEKQEIYLISRIGLVQWGEDCHVEQLILSGNSALRRAKQNGEIFSEFNVSEMAANHINIDMMREIRKAIIQESFSLYFQPKVERDSQSIVGAEVLIRWNHPERGLIPPDAFIGFAERTGIIDRITEYVIFQLGLLRDTLSQNIKQPFSLSFNISPAEIKNAKLIIQLERLQAQYKNSAIQLEVEVTESVFINDYERTAQAIQTFKNLGYRILLDDFGTGFSNLSYISKLPIDYIKIDKYFVMTAETEKKSMSIIHAICQLAKELNVGLIAEGVETLSQQTILNDLNCTTHQGYLYAKPLPLTEFIKLIH